jgi:hypothetical protein
MQAPQVAEDLLRSIAPTDVIGASHKENEVVRPIFAEDVVQACAAEVARIDHLLFIQLINHALGCMAAQAAYRDPAINAQALEAVLERRSVRFELNLLAVTIIPGSQAVPVAEDVPRQVVVSQRVRGLQAQVRPQLSSSAASTCLKKSILAKGRVAAPEP